MAIENYLGKRIKMLREYRNYSQKYMAMQLGIEQSAYSKIESGQIGVKSERLNNIARILGVGINDIMNNEIQFLPKHSEEEKSMRSLLEDLVAEIRNIKEMFRSSLSKDHQ